MGLIKLFSLIVILFVLYFFIKMIYDFIVRKTREGFNIKKFYNKEDNKK
jgi:hypothetical protein